MNANHLGSLTKHARADIGSACRLLCQNWVSNITTARGWRLNLLHGFALFAMAVDFLGGASWLSRITAGNSLLFCLAGALISCAGLIVGLVNAAIALQEGWRTAQTQLLRRAMALYKLNGALTRIFSSGVLLLHLPVTRNIAIDNLSNLVHNFMAWDLSIHRPTIPWQPTAVLLTALIGLWLVASSAGLSPHQPLRVTLNGTVGWRATRILRKS